ncbi:hypothetical protein ABW21_db0200588 [Orbilia brochopaga]|nr:hypothetical protein ABW21_db0200588 [Drechslerella brochopaga]
MTQAGTPAEGQRHPGYYTDFIGLPSHPKCVFRTGPVWPRGWGDRRELRPVLNHPLCEVWDTVGQEIYQHLDSLGILWTSLDPVRFGLKEHGESTALHIWIGVVPGSLSYDDARIAAIGCQTILAKAHLTDIEVAFRESIYGTTSGAQLRPVGTSIALEDVEKPFSAAMGIPIAPMEEPHFEGTAGVYIKEGGNSHRIFLLTARHVVLPPAKYHNSDYKRRNSSQRAYNVILLGIAGYDRAIENIEAKIQTTRAELEWFEEEVAKSADAVDEEVIANRNILSLDIAIKKSVIPQVENFHKEITKIWDKNRLDQRIIGHVIHAPSISYGCGPKGFTSDWALINLDLRKIDPAKFQGNVLFIDRSERSSYNKKMNPKPYGTTSIKLPRDGLLQLKGILKESEFRTPTQLDENGEECLLVVKNGMATGLTFGRTSGITSFIRQDAHTQSKPSKEIGVYGQGGNAFSRVGDSGSIVVDGLGRVVGMLTGRVGLTDKTDVSYVTPYFWLDQEIKKAFPDSFLYPSI